MARPWYRNVGPNHPLMEEMIDLYGWEGYGHMAALLKLVDEIGPFELTPKILFRHFNIRATKAQKILPTYTRILSELVGILMNSSKIRTELGKNSTELDHNSTEEAHNYPVRGGQNPHGSTRDLEETEETEETDRQKRNPLPPKGESVDSPKRKKIVSDDWQPNQNFWVWLKENYPNITQTEAMSQLGKFKSYCKANGKGYLDHNAAFRNWMDSPYREKGSVKQQTGLSLGRSKIVPASERKGGVLEL